MEKTIADLAALNAEAAACVRGLRPRAAGATLITLSGELGAGKSAFVKAAAQALGVTDSVTSPTFVIEKQYDLANQAFARLVHIDAYRLKSGAELTPLHFDETLKQAENLIMLEWPEMVRDTLRKADVAIMLTVHPDATRTISYA